MPGSEGISPFVRPPPRARSPRGPRRRHRGPPASPPPRAAPPPRAGRTRATIPPPPGPARSSSPRTSRPQRSSGSAPHPSPGLRPDLSASSWLSRASTTNAPRLPSTRIRGPGVGSHRRRPQVRASARLVADRDEDVVVGGPAARVVDLAVDLRGGAEELQGLIDQVRAQIEQQPAARRAGRDLAPGGAGELRPPALEARLEPVHLAELSLVEQPAKGQEVGVPAAVVEDGERHARRPRPFDQLRAPRRCSPRAACRPRPAGPPRSPASPAGRGRRWRSRSRRGRARRPLPDRVGARLDDGARMLPGRPVAPLRVGGDDRRELQPVRRRDQGRVQVPPASPKPMRAGRLSEPARGAGG